MSLDSRLRGLDGKINESPLYSRRQPMQTTSFNLNLLKTFEALFHCRSVTRAARELGISPSTVSQHLASLREAYGDLLFVPVDREMVPTTAAEELFPSIADALGACARVIPTERKHARAVLIAMSDDFEFVLGRAIADAFKKKTARNNAHHPTNQCTARRTIDSVARNAFRCYGRRHTRQYSCARSVWLSLGLLPL